MAQRMTPATVMIKRGQNLSGSFIFIMKFLSRHPFRMPLTLYTLWWAGQQKPGYRRTVQNAQI